jgi:hypothetical protein
MIVSDEGLERVWRPTDTWQTKWRHFKMEGHIRLSTRQRYVEGRGHTHEGLLIEDVVMEEIGLVLAEEVRETNYPILRRRT